jgi:hypothetical protein
MHNSALKIVYNVIFAGRVMEALLVLSLRDREKGMTVA